MTAKTFDVCVNCQTPFPHGTKGALVKPVDRIDESFPEDGRLLILCPECRKLAKTDEALRERVFQIYYGRA
jgi:hypothetical protein